MADVEMRKESRDEGDPCRDAGFERDGRGGAHSWAVLETSVLVGKMLGGGDYRSTTRTRTLRDSAIACSRTERYRDANMPGMKRMVVVDGLPMSA